ncbi:hypothetical protein [Oceaniferula marina]|uniref:hypothetical protein n=1 Tax=Oceaniferula marina TaxID=2748318 RepID=UPI001D0360A3|nr:hypothetical protein [Oceaniferula marina]
MIKITILPFDIQGPCDPPFPVFNHLTHAFRAIKQNESMNVIRHGKKQPTTPKISFVPRDKGWLQFIPNRNNGKLVDPPWAGADGNKITFREHATHPKRRFMSERFASRLHHTNTNKNKSSRPEFSINI